MTIRFKWILPANQSIVMETTNVTCKHWKTMSRHSYLWDVTTNPFYFTELNWACIARCLVRLSEARHNGRDDKSPKNFQDNYKSKKKSLLFQRGKPPSLGQVSSILNLRAANQEGPGMLPSFGCNTCNLCHLAK
mmetsp:Transcript_277/g.420  ORF Transcript_277/g.420 Transcript_277/m.420 type:complete len:134 (-) Transcript_277:2367-2768(-)